MPLRNLHFIVVSIILGLIQNNVFALVPLESLLLGNFEDRYEEDISDPLYYIFRDIERERSNVNQRAKDDQNLLKFVLYRGLIDEGHNLHNMCRNRPQIDYPSTNDLNTAKRIYLTTLQYMLLDISTNYMATYAHYFDFNEEEYENLINNLVGNHCSENLTTLSLKQLRQNMRARFSKNKGLALPSVEDDPFFTKAMSRVNTGPDAKKKEFYWTVELFKSSCSWAGDIENARLLVPLARNPLIAAAVIREISGLGLSWDKELEKVIRIPIENGLRISCKNLICRKGDNATFLKQVPKAVGSNNLQNDFERLYCAQFRDLDYTLKNQEPKILSKIKSITFDEENLLSGQLFSLMSGYPDFFVQAENYSDLMAFMRSPMDRTWDKWAREQNANYKKTMTYEESLTVELVDPELYYSNVKPDFSVELDINQGEFDKSLNIKGKLRLKVELKVKKKFLSWVRDNWKIIDEKKEVNKAERIRIPFRVRLSDTFKELKEKFPIVPWNDALKDVVVNEFSRQISAYEGNYFTVKNEGVVSLPIYLNFSPYALKHMRYRYLIRKNETGKESDLARLRNLSLSF